MEMNQSDKQTVLMGLGLEKSTAVVYNRIAADNMFYSAPVFAPVFMLSLVLAFGENRMLLWGLLLLQAVTGAWLAVYAARSRRKERYVRANVPLILHVGVCMLTFIAYAATAGSEGAVWFVLFLACLWLFGLLAIPMAYMILVIFAEALAVALLFPTPYLTVLPMGRTLLGVVSVFYITGLRYYRKSCQILDEERIRQEKTELETVAKTDSVTGVLNRRGGDEMIAAYLMQHPNSPAFLVLIGINDFKTFNDLYGHETGNTLLHTMTRELVSTFGAQSEIIRNGSSEFAVFLKDASDRQAALDKISDYVGSRHMFTADGVSYTYEVTVGYTVYPDQADTIQSLYVKADRALYYAKLHGNLSNAYDDSLLWESRTYRDFNFRDIAMGIPGALLIYKAHEDEQILFANDELVRIFECEDMKDLLDHVGNSFRTLVHPEDILRVENSIWNQINSGDDSLDYVEYRIITKNGTVKNIVDFGKLVHNPHYGDIFYVFLYDEKDKELTLRRALAGIEEEKLSGVS